jgi:hypothetical protein
MKRLGMYLILGLLTLNASAAGRDAEFARKAELLGKLAFGTTTLQFTAGTSAEDMVLNMAMDDRGETKEEALQNFTVDTDGENVAFGDQIGWGTLTLKGAINVYGMDDDSGEAEAKRKAKESLGKQLLKELARMGAKFGFTDGSSSYCGMSFVGLLIIDEKTGRVFEIALTSSGECFVR